MTAMGKRNTAHIMDVERVWLTTEDVEKYLGMGRTFVDNLRKSGKLGFYVLGRTVFVKKSELDALIESGREIPTTVTTKY